MARVAAVQHGVFSRTQATEAGAGRGLIASRVGTRKWVLRYAGVYLIAGSPRSWKQELLAACFAANHAFASHRSAAAVWQLPGGAQGILELSIPRGRRVRLPGLLVHQADALTPADVTITDAIPLTTATRTIVDLASVISTDILEEALDDALRRRLTSLSRLRWRLGQLEPRGRRGIGTLRGFVEARSGSAVTGSPLETRFIRLLRGARLPLPQCQCEIRDHGRLLARVDFAYPDIRLAIEVDGYRWHSGRVRWERDLARRNELTMRGWRVVHVTWSDLEERPEHVVQMIVAALAKA